MGGHRLSPADRLRELVDEGETRSREWPNSPEALSNRLRRAATFLRKVGVEVSFHREGKERSRTITILFSAPKEGGGIPSAPSEPSAKSTTTNDYNGFQADGLTPAPRIQPSAMRPADTSTVRHQPNRPPTVRLNPLKHKAADTADGAGRLPTPYFRGRKDTHMSAPALEALAAAEAAGVTITLDGDGLILEAKPEPPPDIVALLKTVKPDLLRDPGAGRPLAPPSRPRRRPTARSDVGPWLSTALQHFVNEGWGDQAALIGWSPEELYRVPPLWSRVDLTGAALLIGDRRVIAVTEASIVIETPSGSQLKFRRIGREHIA